MRTTREDRGLNPRLLRPLRPSHGEVTATAGAATTNGWTTRWTLSGGQTISQVWNAIVNLSGSSVNVRNVGWNGSLNPRTSTTFGFLANGSPSAPTVTCTSP